MKYELNIAHVKRQFDNIQELYYVLSKLDIESGEIDACIEDLIVTDNNVVHFGVNRTFMWTEKRAA